MVVIALLRSSPALSSWRRLLFPQNASPCSSMSDHVDPPSLWHLSFLPSWLPEFFRRFTKENLLLLTGMLSPLPRQACCSPINPSIGHYNEQLRAGTLQPYRSNDQSNRAASSCIFEHPSHSPASVPLGGPLLLNLRVPFFAGACFSLDLAPSAQVHNIPPPTPE